MCGRSWRGRSKSNGGVKQERGDGGDSLFFGGGRQNLR